MSTDKNMQKLTIHEISYVIDYHIRKIEELLKTSIPKENSKSLYLQACWLLSKWQWLRKYSSRKENQGLIDDNIQFLKDNLDYIKNLRM